MECRAGTIYLRASLKWIAGLYGFFLVWLCCSGYFMVEMVGGGGEGRGSVFFFSCCQFSWRLDVCGRIFVLYYLIFFGEFVDFSCGFVF